MKIKIFKILTFLFLLLSLVVAAISFFLYDKDGNSFMLFHGFLEIYLYLFTFFYLRWSLKKETSEYGKRETAKTYTFISIINLIPGLSMAMAIILCVMWLRDLYKEYDNNNNIDYDF